MQIWQRIVDLPALPIFGLPKLPVGAYFKLKTGLKWVRNSKLEPILINFNKGGCECYQNFKHSKLQTIFYFTYLG
jgi:hypothetical protein